MKKDDSTSPINLNLSTIMSFIVFLVVTLAFFWRLNAVVGTGFGFREILFSIIISILITLFLLWMRTLMKKNLYLGLIISLLTLSTLDYSLMTQYKGPNTNTFLIIFSLLFSAYILYIFFRNFKSDRKKKFIDNDNLN